MKGEVLVREYERVLTIIGTKKAELKRLEEKRAKIRAVLEKHFDPSKLPAEHLPDWMTLYGLKLKVPPALQAVVELARRCGDIDAAIVERELKTPARQAGVRLHRAFKVGLLERVKRGVYRVR